MHTHSTEIIAVVDDDKPTRTAIASLVRSMGCSVEAFESAMAFLQSHDIEHVACLISDVRMPGMTGVQMHDRLLELGHRFPTIFVTAHLIPEVEAKVGTPGVIAVLLKPIDAGVLAEHLEQALASR